jgi:hypothetical protein
MIKISSFALGVRFSLHVDRSAPAFRPFYIRMLPPRMKPHAPNAIGSTSSSQGLLRHPYLSVQDACQSYVKDSRSPATDFGAGTCALALFSAKNNKSRGIQTLKLRPWWFLDSAIEIHGNLISPDSLVSCPPTSLNKPRNFPSIFSPPSSSRSIHHPPFPNVV